MEFSSKVFDARTVGEFFRDFQPISVKRDRTKIELFYKPWDQFQLTYHIKMVLVPVNSWVGKNEMVRSSYQKSCAKIARIRHQREQVSDHEFGQAATYWPGFVGKGGGGEKNGQ